jgi:4-phosphopantoate--beta-alanine ligase
MTDHARDLAAASAGELEAIVEGFDAEAARADAERTIREGDLGQVD